MNTVLRAVPLVVFVILAGAPAFAASPARVATCEDGSTPAYFYLETSAFGCQLVFGPSPVVTVQVRMTAVPSRKVRFSLPDPPAGIVVGETWNYPSTGNRINGLELDLGACSPEGAVLLGSLTIFLSPGTLIPCLPWQIDDGCEIEDCDGVWRVGQAWQQDVSDPGVSFCGCCFQCCQALPPYGPVPANGATGISTDVTLSWSGPPHLATPDQDQFVDVFVRLSTDPACGSGQTTNIPATDKTFSPGPLQPGTTYYWQVRWIEYFSGCSSGDGAESPIFSFTTAGPLAAEPSTWGRVKALYRD